MTYDLAVHEFVYCINELILFYSIQCSEISLLFLARLNFSYSLFL